MDDLYASECQLSRIITCLAYDQPSVFSAENRRTNLRIDAKTNDGRSARAIADWVFNGFDGKLTSTKWPIIAKCSQDTAQRDIQGLIDQGILVKDAAGGRSTSYSLLEA